MADILEDLQTYAINAFPGSYARIPRQYLWDAAHQIEMLRDEVQQLRTASEGTYEAKRALRNRLSAELAAEGPQDRAQPKMRIYLNRKLRDQATPNKLAAHAVHAALVALGVHPDCKVVVLDAGPTVIEKMTTVIHDAGHTQLAPGTMTAGTNWPEDSDD